jgi:hypothetical protein
MVMVVEQSNGSPQEFSPPIDTSGAGAEAEVLRTSLAEKAAVNLLHPHVVSNVLHGAIKGILLQVARTTWEAPSNEQQGLLDRVVPHYLFLCCSALMPLAIIQNHAAAAWGSSELRKGPMKERTSSSSRETAIRMDPPGLAHLLLVLLHSSPSQTILRLLDYRRWNLRIFHTAGEGRTAVHS